MASGAQAASRRIANLHVAADIADIGSMNLAFVWGAAAVLSGWIILSLLGAERDRKVREFEASQPPPAPTPAPEPEPVAAAPKPKSVQTAPPKRKAA
jgi:hypothetical protein